MKRRYFAWILLASLMLSGCSLLGKTPVQQQYSITYLEYFDTVTTVTGRADNEIDFQEKARVVQQALAEYHCLFDIYNSYEGINNLKTVNDYAGIQPIAVDERIMKLLLDCKVYDSLTDGRVNIAMGSLLTLWHDAREAGISDPEQARLPTVSELAEAAKHRNMKDLILDEVNGTVFLADPDMRLDVGAIAKGWAVREICRIAPEGLLISVGGNVATIGPKDATGAPWIIGIENPDGGDYLHTVKLNSGSVVTSGDYQRTYFVDGKPYHHIIDPDTLYPADFWRSVSVICEDSALADALSTALFTLPLEAGQALIAACGAEAMWVDSKYHIFYSAGFPNYIRS